MNKLIIENKTDLPWLDVLAYVASVVNMGRISNDGKQYCYVSTFKTPAGTVAFSPGRRLSHRIPIAPKERSRHCSIAP